MFTFDKLLVPASPFHRGRASKNLRYHYERLHGEFTRLNKIFHPHYNNKHYLTAHSPTIIFPGVDLPRDIKIVPRGDLRSIKSTGDAFIVRSKKKLFRRVTEHPISPEEVFSSLQYLDPGDGEGEEHLRICREYESNLFRSTYLFTLKVGNGRLAINPLYAKIINALKEEYELALHRCSKVYCYALDNNENLAAKEFPDIQRRFNQLPCFVDNPNTRTYRSYTNSDKVAIVSIPHNEDFHISSETLSNIRSLVLGIILERAAKTLVFSLPRLLNYRTYTFGAEETDDVEALGMQEYIRQQAQGRVNGAINDPLLFLNDVSSQYGDKSLLYSQELRELIQRAQDNLVMVSHAEDSNQFLNYLCKHHEATIIALAKVFEHNLRVQLPSKCSNAETIDWEVARARILDPRVKKTLNMLYEFRELCDAALPPPTEEFKYFYYQMFENIIDKLEIPGFNLMLYYHFTESLYELEHKGLL